MTQVVSSACRIRKSWHSVQVSPAVVRRDASIPFRASIDFMYGHVPLPFRVERDFPVQGIVAEMMPSRPRRFVRSRRNA